MKSITKFKEKIVFIFGGSSGIGLSLAKKLSAEGAHVVIFARTEKRLIAAIEEIQKHRLSDTQTTEYKQVDVSNCKSVDSVIALSAETYGAPDILINCAGRAYPRYFEDISFKQFDETMKTNMYGIWNTCSAAVPLMKKKGGWIINTSSMVGFLGVFGYTDYAASKFAIMGFSEALRSELEQFNIGVSILCPPDTDTPGFETENETKPEETRIISEGANIMTPDDVADICLKGLKKSKKIIIPGFDGKMTYLVKRFAPYIVDIVMNRSIKKVQKH